jgi:hypothetical protein
MLSPSLYQDRHYAARFPDWAGRFSLAFSLQPDIEGGEQTMNKDVMTHPSNSTSSPSGLRDQAIAALVPFFSDGNAGDETTAHVVAEGLLDDYKAMTPKELQLSAQIIAFGWASLACVSASMVVKDQSLEEMLRLQGHAIALDRLSQKAIKALNARRKERAANPGGMTPASTGWDESSFRDAINQAREKMNEANAKLAAFMATVKPAEPPTPKLKPLFGEPMTPAVLARRRRG